MLHIFFSLTESSFEYVVGFKVVRLLDSNSTGTYSRALSIRILKFVWMWYILDHFNSNSVFKYSSAQLWRIYPSGKYRGLLANITLDTYRVFGFILKNCVLQTVHFLSVSLQLVTFHWIQVSPQCHCFYIIKNVHVFVIFQ